MEWCQYDLAIVPSNLGKEDISETPEKKDFTFSLSQQISNFFKKKRDINQGQFPARGDGPICPHSHINMSIMQVGQTFMSGGRMAFRLIVVEHC